MSDELAEARGEYTGPCRGCKHEIPIMADCRRREVGEDGYMHFPEGYCYEKMEVVL